ncbi:hypothetical protein [Acetobacterium bakii]|uniref:Uncharacterized protein n=1 Tax=Acetobacterium bakii TaxID=52689 RepID=A0A0L6U1N3_9FIRM|nr:hypothetical protein [Acetobacterium bakii]KNZ42413.1 hypothetical protein AKG39_06505 [Acetobacterium bakii]
MKRLSRFFTSRDAGVSAPVVAVLILIVVMTMCAVYERLRIVTIVSQLDQAVEMSVQGVATENWDNVYQGVREGYAGTYTKDALTDDWEAVMNKEQILDQMNHMIDFKVKGSTWVKEDDAGNVLFSMKPKETTVKIINTSLAADEGDALTVETTNTITVPWLFLGAMFDAPPIVVERKTVCGYTPKF